MGIPPPTKVQPDAVRGAGYGGISSFRFDVSRAHVQDKARVQICEEAFQPAV